MRAPTHLGVHEFSCSKCYTQSLNRVHVQGTNKLFTRAMQRNSLGKASMSKCITRYL